MRNAVLSIGIAAGLMLLPHRAETACARETFENWLREPTALREQFTLTSSFLAIAPRAANVLTSGCSEVNVMSSVTNTFAKSQSLSYSLRLGLHAGDSPADRVRLAIGQRRRPLGSIFFSDGELHSTVLSYRRGLGNQTDLEAKFTVNHLSGGGIGERIIEGFHHTFALGNDVRDLFPPSLQLSYIRSGQREVLYDASSYVYSSLTLAATRELVSSPHQVWAVRTLLKVPLQTSGFASRSLDEGIELIGRHDFRYASLHASAAAIHDGPASGLLTRSKTNISWSVELVAPLTRRTAVSAQLAENKSALATLPLTELRRPSYQFVAGLRRRIGPRSLLLFNFTEHVAAFENTADVGLNLGISWRP